MDALQAMLQKKDRAIFIAIILLAFLFGYNVLYKYYLGRIHSIRTQINQETKKNDILRIIGGLDSKLQEYQKRSFQTAEITAMLDKISELAKEIDLPIRTFNPLQPQYREKYTELALEVPLRCKYHKLGQFLSVIESNEELLWVTKLSMRKTAVDSLSGPKIPDVDLTVSGLYLK